MPWDILETLDITRASQWELTSVFNPTVEFVLIEQSMTINNTIVRPEQTKIRGLWSIAENRILDRIQCSPLIFYTSDSPLVLRLPFHPFTSPFLCFRLINDFYQKFDPIWSLTIFTWDPPPGNNAPGNNSPPGQSKK